MAFFLRSLLLPCFFTSVLFSNDTVTSLANLESEPSAIVAQAVNIITGDYSDHQLDLLVPGAEPIAIERFYSSGGKRKGTLDTGSLGSCWHLNHCGKVVIEHLYPSKTNLSARHESGGAIGLFLGTAKKMVPSKKMFQIGATNCGSGELSGQTSVKNHSLEIVEKGNKCLLKTGSGKVEEFARKNDLETTYRMTKCISPNKNHLAYGYDGSRISVISANNQLGVPLSQVKFSYPDPCRIQIASADAGEVKYTFIKEKTYPNQLNYYLSEIERSGAPWEKYFYGKNEGGRIDRVVRKERPDSRFLEVEYYKKGNNYLGKKNIVIKDDFDIRCGRVRLLKAPVGTDAAPIITHSFVYHIPGTYTPNKFSCNAPCTTGVYDALDNKTDYHYTVDQRLSAIVKFTTPDRNIYRIERLYWGEDGNAGDLVSRTLEDGLGNILLCRRLAYDANHNIACDLLYGNLTGNNNASLHVNEKGIPLENGCEKYAKTFVYSKDGLNLLLQESDGKKTVCYNYLPGTNLLASKYTLDAQQKIILREFYSYDANGICVKEVVDDGASWGESDLAGVTQRNIKYTIPSLQTPVGFPKIVLEMYYDLATGQECLLHKTVNSYTSDGHLTRQEHYDSLGQYLYTLSWTYNDLGKPVSETNAAGQTAYRDYDANGNLIYEKFLDRELYFTYDFSNRLIREEQALPNGQRLVQSFRYDYLGNKVSEVDARGNETFYTYDEFGRMLTCSLPAYYNKKGSPIVPMFIQQYDHLSNVTARADANGSKTLTKYNIRGQPTEIIYPDGSRENNTYTLDGRLHRHVNKNGSYVVYSYDCLDREVKQEVYGSDNQLLYTTSKQYGAFHLLSETDREGMLTTYTYDYAGRLIAVLRGSQKRQFLYDTLGRLIAMVYPDKKVSQQFDIMNRVIETKEEDLEGNLLSVQRFVYDQAGNRIETITYNQAGENIQHTEYDACNNPVLIRDALGYETVIQYDYLNGIKRITDPLGNTKTIISNSNDLESRVFLTNSQGELLHKTRKRYDANGNLVSIKETVYGGRDSPKDVYTLFTYDSMNRLVKTTEAAGEPCQASSEVHFNQAGQKAEVIKKDGTTIGYSYDREGKLARYSSSDGTIDYSYSYDSSGRLIQVIDAINNLERNLTYDREGLLIAERLMNGLTLHFRYDENHRLAAILLPDNSAITYQYEAGRLKRVGRQTVGGDEAYSHEYLEYDLSGNRVRTKLIGQLGEVHYAFDKLGREVSIHSTFRKETVPEHGFDGVGCLLERHVEDSLGAIECNYRYDERYQLCEETGLAENSYAYDSLSNRLEKNADSYELDAANHLLKQGNVSYAYDLNGNRVRKDDAITYEYDALDRLVEVREKSLRYRYCYDDRNRRMSKTGYVFNSDTCSWVETHRCDYLYVDQDEIGSVEGGEIRELRVLGIGRCAEIGAAVAMEFGGEVYAPMHDLFGNVVELVSITSGDIIESYCFSAFGEEEVFRLGGRVLNPWRFSSKRVDCETGFVYFGNRYYDVEVGRWLTADPLGYVDGPNLYAYVGNNPLTNVDPYGLWAQPDVMQPGQKSSQGNWSTRAVRALASIPRAVGRVIELIGKHLVPIPVVRDGFEMLGHVMQNGNLKGYVMSYRRQHSYAEYVGLEKGFHPKVRVTSENGICTDKDLAFRRGTSISKELGYAVLVIYNADKGLIFGAMDTALTYLGVPTHSYQIKEAALRGEVAELKKCGGIELNSITFSQSAGMLKKLRRDLPKSEAEMINIYTMGSPKIFHSKKFKSVTNYVSPHDPVPIIGDPIGFTKNYIGYKNYVNFIKPEKGFLLDHSYEDTYLKYRNEIVNQIKERMQSY